MWKNKHVVVAMLIAPVLAIMAWFAVDYFVAERPHAARAGADYPLVAKSNCRYESGACDLENADFRLTLTGSRDEGDGLVLQVRSRHALAALSIGLATSPGADSVPVALARQDATGTHWAGRLGTAEGAALQIVAEAGESRYYAEVPTIFMEPGEPLFER